MRKMHDCLYQATQRRRLSRKSANRTRRSHGFLEHYASFFSAPSEHDWCKTLFAVGAKLGFEHTLFALLPRQNMEFERAFLRSNYADCWRDIYDRGRMAYIDPTVTHCLGHNAPLIWSPDIFLDVEQKQMYEEACSFGLRSGVSFPIHCPNGEVGILSLATARSPSEVLWKDIAHQLTELSLVRDIASDSGRRFACARKKESAPMLTKREIECLKWTAIGKSSWDISQILQCSEATVNFHMTNVRRKFQVSSRRAAAVKAARFGLL